jgi:hypothetical protein
MGSTYGRYTVTYMNILRRIVFSCWEDPDLKLKEDFPDAKLLTSVKIF